MQELTLILNTAEKRIQFALCRGGTALFSGLACPARRYGASGSGAP